jgi:hypothetical protein
MKTKILMTILAGLLVVTVVSMGLLAANADNPGRKPDKLKPVHATDIELVKKISVRGKPPWAQGGGGSNKSREVATGVLGVEVSGTRYAVVVGISDYPGEEYDLNYCDDDADDMYDVLTKYGFSEENITLLVDEEATRDAILTAIENVGDSVISDDEVVFFFSGHGMSGHADDGDREGKDEAIVAHDGDPHGKLVPIWDGELKDAFSGFETTRIIFIFDTCLAGGMAEDLEGPGRVIAMACGENGYAYEFSELQNGEFTYYFVEKGIGDGLANIHDYNENGVLNESEWVTVEEAFGYAKANCRYDKPTVADEFDNDLLP